MLLHIRRFTIAQLSAWPWVFGSMATLANDSAGLYVVVILLRFPVLRLAPPLSPICRCSLFVCCAALGLALALDFCVLFDPDFDSSCPRIRLENLLSLPFLFFFLFFFWFIFPLLVPHSICLGKAK